MSDAAPPPVPRLPRGVWLHQCKVRDCWFLQAPERAVKLDQISVAILQTVDGERDVPTIAAVLAKSFSAPKEQIEADVRRFLNDLAQRRMIEIAR
ncbi:MAG: pyrroloquinoline quinone biosynthesis peptide chaperone PqqD [Pseudomonadota bacterium]